MNKVKSGIKDHQKCDSPVAVVLWLAGAVLDDLRVELPLEAHLGGRGGGRAAEQRKIASLLKVYQSSLVDLKSV